MSACHDQQPSFVVAYFVSAVVLHAERRGVQCGGDPCHAGRGIAGIVIDGHGRDQHSEPRLPRNRALSSTTEPGP